jgi:hypothetical protein
MLTVRAETAKENEIEKDEESFDISDSCPGLFRNI